MPSRSPEEANIEAGHARLEELQSCDADGKERKRGDHALAQSKIDKKNNASRILFECADRMKDSVVVLRQCLDVLSDPNVSTCAENDALKTL